MRTGVCFELFTTLFLDKTEDWIKGNVKSGVYIIKNKS